MAARGCFGVARAGARAGARFGARFGAGGAAVVLLCLAAGLMAAGPARADCSVPGYAAEADRRLAGYPPCDELEIFNIETPRGPRQVRLIRDRRMPADWAEPVAIARRAIIRSAETLQAIGQGTVPNLLVLLSGLQPSETLPESEDPEATEADRLSLAEGIADGRSGDECLMLVYPANSPASELDFVVAHEFFHCVQFDLAGAQMNARSDGRPDAWWVEGMAEWFANRAYPERDASGTYVANFDAHSPESPLTDMSYDAFVYWSWYARQRGDGAVLQVLPTTPTADGEEPQMRAAADMIGPERWLDFVQTYLDREPRYPDGRRLPVMPEEGESHLWTETAEERLEGERLALHRAQLIFTCGKWQIETEDEEGRWKVRDLEAPGAWRELPEELDIAPGEEKRFLLGAIGLGAEGFRLTIRATQETESREACLCGSFAEEYGSRRDSCLAGSWQLASGGLNEWMNRHLEQINRASGTWAYYRSETSADDGGRKLFLGTDGRYHYGASEIGWTQEGFNEKDERFASRINSVGGGAGYWSTDDGLLNVCAVSEAAEATAELDLKGERMTVQLPGYLSDHLSSGAYRYDCSADSLHLRHIEIPGTPSPMEWHYRRVD